MSHIQNDIEQLTRQLTTAATPGGPPEVVVMLMGHLPARGGLWRLPAAAALSRGATELLVTREDEHEIFIEHLAVDACPRSGTSLELAAGGLCVVVPPSGASLESIQALNGDRFAVVTGTNQAAIVAAYGLIKDLQWEEPGDLELIMVGQPPTGVAEIAHRLSEAVERHLGHRLTLTAVLERIETTMPLVRSASLSRPAGGLQEIVKTIRCGIRDEPAEGPHPVSDAGHRFLAGGRPELTPSPEKSVIESPPHLAEAGRLGATRPTTSEVAASAPIKVCAEDTTPSITPMSHAPAPDPSAVTESAPPPQPPPVEGFLHHLAGMRDTEIRCPDQKTIELAIDQEGGLHLLAGVEDANRVPAVVGWATRHRALLERAIPELDPSTPDPTVHVFGSEIKDLLAIRETPWCAHLLVRAEALGSDGVACIPLQDGPHGPD